MSIGVISWTNETSLSPYPLASSFGYDNVLVDANFVQFDNFVPVLNSIELVDTNLELVITFDIGPVTISVPISNLSEYRYSHRITYDNRFLGQLVFGEDVFTILDNTLGNLNIKNIGIPFLPLTVRSIPSTAGVYSLAGKYGPVVMDSEPEIWFDVNSNDVTFNAVAGIDYSDTKYLKTLNSVHPVTNGVYIRDNLVIKVRSLGSSTIEVTLVGASDVSSLLRSDSIITTNG